MWLGTPHGLGIATDCTHMHFNTTAAYMHSVVTMCATQQHKHHIVDMGKLSG